MRKIVWQRFDDSDGVHETDGQCDKPDAVVVRGQTKCCEFGGCVRIKYI